MDLGSLKKGTLFIIPWQRDELPTETSGCGRPYLYKVSRINGDGTILVYNKDLRTFSKYPKSLKVETL